MLALAAPAQAREGPVELGTAINDAGFRFGGAEYRDTFTENFDAATAESAMKMTALQPQQGQFEFDGADEIVDWARAAGKKVHGHVLVWCADEWTPAWVVNGTWTRDELLAVMEDHIRTVVDHFEGRVHTWDVVNEALTAEGARKDCVWQRVIGDDWVARAFAAARAVDPGVRLLYNEYAADFPNPKFEALVALVRGLDLDGVGLQHHTYGYAPYQYDVEDAIARLGALGLDVHVSELNVTTSQIGGDLREQAEAYWTIAAACQAQPACFRVTTWGFTDAYGWRPPSEKAMPFDEDYQPKPAWHALERGLARTAGPQLGPPGPPTSPAAVTQSQGELSWPQVGDATYTLQHRDAGNVWRTVATGMWWPGFSLYEREGTWQYRARAEDGAWSEPSTPVKVDRTPPGVPYVVPQVAWFRDSAMAGFAADDPPLPDGSPGSGVEPTPLQPYAGQGVIPLRFVRVSDRAGNVSPELNGELRIDAAPPRVGLTCPGRIVRGARATGRFSASDEASGLATPPAGTVALGPRGSASVTARDVAGHTATASCRYAVLAPVRLFTRTAAVRDAAVRLRLGCRLAVCRGAVTLRRGGRTIGRRRLTLAGTRTVAVRVRRGGAVAVSWGSDRLGLVRVRAR
ncbi:MAG TPA: endo-1,4-beta-xylanase [Solirubrobacteraceae bacterium]|nr:endo-1,4-beta-xylanase [Solirubrobacteraceae bacterium]